jgi:hypothetical protein
LFPGSPTGAGVPHPFACDSTGNPILITPPPNVQEGDQLVVMVLPFGSFAPQQTPATINVTVASRAGQETPMR